MTVAAALLSGIKINHNRNSSVFGLNYSTEGKADKSCDWKESIRLWRSSIIGRLANGVGSSGWDARNEACDKLNVSSNLRSRGESRQSGNYWRINEYNSTLEIINGILRILYIFGNSGFKIGRDDQALVVAVGASIKFEFGSRANQRNRYWRWLI
ncbi:hypothetical protein AB0758_30870 [Tolypothrix bouteillei VB521301_2]|uniref:hypothetical protein n=1 Tax=Tolypothrix bouteillei TaxID=1246981 RepID=UPI0038B62C01